MDKKKLIFTAEVLMLLAISALFTGCDFLNKLKDKPANVKGVWEVKSFVNENFPKEHEQELQGGVKVKVTVKAYIFFDGNGNFYGAAESVGPDGKSLGIVKQKEMCGTYTVDKIGIKIKAPALKDIPEVPLPYSVEGNNLKIEIPSQPPFLEGTKVKSPTGEQVKNAKEAA